MTYTRIDEITQRDNYVQFPLMNKAVEFCGGKYSMSIQASEDHMSIPKENTFLSDYTHFEVLLDIPYAMVPKDWAQYRNVSFFAFVPKEKVIKLVNDMVEFSLNYGKAQPKELYPIYQLAHMVASVYVKDGRLIKYRNGLTDDENENQRYIKMMQEQEEVRLDDMDFFKEKGKLAIEENRKITYIGFEEQELENIGNGFQQG